MESLPSSPANSTANINGKVVATTCISTESRNAVGVAGDAFTIKPSASIDVQADVNDRMLEKLRHIVGVAEGVIAANQNGQDQSDANVRLLEQLRGMIGIAEGTVTVAVDTDAHVQAGVNARLLEQLNTVVGAVEGNANADANVSDALRNVVDVLDETVAPDSKRKVRLVEKVQKMISCAISELIKCVKVNSSIILVSTSVASVVAVLLMYHECFLAWLHCLFFAVIYCAIILAAVGAFAAVMYIASMLFPQSPLPPETATEQSPPPARTSLLAGADQTPNYHDLGRSVEPTREPRPNRRPATTRQPVHEEIYMTDVSEDEAEQFYPDLDSGRYHNASYRPSTPPRRTAAFNHAQDWMPDAASDDDYDDNAFDAPFSPDEHDSNGYFGQQPSMNHQDWHDSHYQRSAYENVNMADAFEDEEVEEQLPYVAGAPYYNATFYEPSPWHIPAQSAPRHTAFNQARGMGSASTAGDVSGFETFASASAGRARHSYSQRQHAPSARDFSEGRRHTNMRQAEREGAFPRRTDYTAAFDAFASAQVPASSASRRAAPDPVRTTAPTAAYDDARAFDNLFFPVAGPAPFGYFKKHRVLSTDAGRGVWMNVNNKQIVYENMADAARAAATVLRYPDLVRGHHHNATFGM